MYYKRLKYPYIHVYIIKCNLMQVHYLLSRAVLTYKHNSCSIWLYTWWFTRNNKEWNNGKYILECIVYISKWIYKYRYVCTIKSTHTLLYMCIIIISFEVELNTIELNCNTIYLKFEIFTRIFYNIILFHTIKLTW